MAALTEVRVPDLGEFADVPVIEVLVAPGQSVAEEEPLIVLESDKASMEVPAPAAGVVADVVVAVGDEVSQGDVIVRLSGDGSSPTEEEVVASETWPQEEEPTEEEIEANYEDGFLVIILPKTKGRHKVPITVIENDEE